MKAREPREEAVLKALLSRVLENDDAIFPTSDEAIDLLMAESGAEDLREDLVQEIKQRLFHKKGLKAKFKKRDIPPISISPAFSKPAYEGSLFRKKKEIDSKTKGKLEQHRKKIKKEQNEA